MVSNDWLVREPVESLKVRTFPTGATRDTTEGKLEYAGFNSPLVEKAFAEYMHIHRKQSDGQLRDSGNWKKGMPRTVYHESLHRHYMDLWLHREGYPEEAKEPDLITVLCAIRFNVNGLLLEELKAGKQEAPEYHKALAGPDEECPF